MIDWGLGIAVTLCGLLVVFAALLLLVFFCWAMGKVFRSVSNRQKGDNAPKAEKKPAPKAEAPKAAPVQAAAQPETGLADDVVAAITGAIACILGPDRPFAIRSIRRAGNPGRAGRNVWNAAGIAESTRPF